MVPTFTTESIDEGGAHLDPDSIATATPRTFTVASPPDRLAGFGVSLDHTSGPDHALHPGPYPSGLSRHWTYGASHSGSSRTPFSSVLAGPGPSDSADPSRTLSGLLPPSRAFPRSGCPQLHQPAATGQRRSHLTSTRFHSASWRTNGFQ